MFSTGFQFTAFKTQFITVSGVLEAFLIAKEKYSQNHFCSWLTYVRTARTRKRVLSHVSFDCNSFITFTLTCACKHTFTSNIFLLTHTVDLLVVFGFSNSLSMFIRVSIDTQNNTIFFIR